MRKNNWLGQLFKMAASFIGGYATATLFDFTSLTHWTQSHLLNQASVKKPAVRLAQPEPDLPKPKFEFYTLLAKGQHPTSMPTAVKPVVEVAQVKPQTELVNSNASKPNPEPAVTQQLALAVGRVENKPATLPSPTKGNRDAYLVQIASFKNKQDAEHMKAEFAFKGFEVNVIPSVQQNITWFRVIVGPFSTKAAAEKTQLMLAHQERIKGMIRKV